MRKLIRIITLLIIICCISAILSCKKEEKIVIEATDSITIEKEQNINDNSIFLNTKSIKEFKENYSHTCNDGRVINGYLISTQSSYSSCYYGRVIDLKNCDSVISFDVLNNEEYEFDSIDIKLIDIYDAENFIIIRYSKNTNESWSNVACKSSKGSVFIGQGNYKNYDYSENGTTFFNNSFVENNDNKIIKYPFNFSFGDDLTTIYINQDSKNKTKVVNLADGDIVGENAVFKGFTDGRVYMSINFNKISKNAGIVINSIASTNVNEFIKTSLENDLLKLEFSGENKTFFDGAVNYTYNLPSILDTDIVFGKIDFITKVFDNLNSEVAVTNNTFKPTTAGYYKVKYLYKDNFDNNVDKEYQIKVNQVPNDINILYENKELVIGSNITLPSVSITGGSGKLTSTIKYYYNGKEINDNSILLSQPGSISISVDVEDSIGYTLEKSYKEKTYAIKNTCVLTLIDDVPYAFAKNTTITIPKFNAYDYLNDVEMDKSVYINGEQVTTSTYKVLSTLPETIELTYYGNKGQQNEISKTFNVKTIDVQTNNIHTNFDYNDEEFNATSDKNSVTFIAQKDMETACIKYPFALTIDLCCIKVPFSNKSDFSNVTVIMADYIDGTSLSFTVYYDNGSFLLAYNNSKLTKKEVVITDYMQFNNELYVFYDKTKNAILDYAFNEIVTLPIDDNGNKFEKFNNLGIYISFKLEDVRQNAEFYVSQLAGQSMNNSIYRNNVEKTKPDISFVSQPVSGNVSINTNYTIPYCLGFDAFSSSALPVYYSITYNYEPICSNVLITKDSEILLSNYGRYDITFVTTDNNKNQRKTTKTVNVIDEENPTLTVTGEIKYSYTVGKEIQFASFDYQDNLSKKEDIKNYIIIVYPTGEYVAINPTDKYTFEKTGTYKIVYYVEDESGNSAKYSYNISVTGR